MRFIGIMVVVMVILMGVVLVWGEGSISNSYINATLTDEHSINLKTVGGDPNRTSDDAIQILNDENTFAVVRVEEKLTSDQETSGVSFKVGSDGTAVVVPRVTSGNDIEGEWLIDEEIGEDQSARPININIKQKVTVVRDAIRVEYEVTNNDYQAHNLGFMQVLNVEVPVGQTTRVIFWIPGLGVVDKERLLSAWELPAYVRASDDFQNPTALLRATIAPEVESLPSGGWTAYYRDTTKPAYLMIANAGSIGGADDPWDYLTSGMSVTNSAALVLKWMPRLVQPGQSLKFVFYFGVDWSTNDYTYPLAVGIYAPATLSSQATSLTLSCDLYNPSDITIGSAKATLILPQGLSLAQDETATKSLPDIPPRSSATAPDPEAKVSWNINVAQGTFGHLPLIVKVEVPIIGEVARQIVRYVDIPVGYTRRLDGGTNGVCMVSLPFSFTDPRTEKVLGDLGDVSGKVAMWSPLLNRYLFYPTDPQMATLQAGKAFWVKLTAPTTVDVSKNQPQPPTPITGRSDYSVSLYAGWNQIGNPFVYMINWSDVRVSYFGQVKGWSDAVNAGWLRSYIFRWNPQNNAYDWSVAGNYPLQPWEGYFIKVTVPCNLIFPAIPSRGVSTSIIERTPGRTLPAKWLIQLTLISGDVKDGANYIGVGEEMTVEKPPSPTGVYLNIVRDGEALAADVRAPSAQKVWTIEVNAPKGGEIIWKGMESLPKGLRLYIVDENGSRTYMGTTSSYKVEGQRVLRIEAVEGRGKVMITGLRVLPQRGGVNIAFSLSAEATVGLKIITPSGANLRVLPQRVLKDGANSIFWDGRDEKGNPLPSGIYIAEVVARGTDGEFSRAIQMFTLR